MKIECVFVGEREDRIKEYRGIGILCNDNLNIPSRHNECTPRIVLGYREFMVCVCECHKRVDNEARLEIYMKSGNVIDLSMCGGLKIKTFSDGLGNQMISSLDMISPESNLSIPVIDYRQIEAITEENE